MGNESLVAECRNRRGTLSLRALKAMKKKCLSASIFPGDSSKLHPRRASGRHPGSHDSGSQGDENDHACPYI